MKKSVQFRVSLVTAVLILLLTSWNVALGAIRVASVSGNWNDAATWGGQPVPTATDDIIINSGITVSMNVNGSCLTIMDMDGILADGGGMLTIAGNAGVAISDITGNAAILCAVEMPGVSGVTVSGSLSISGSISGIAGSLTKSGAGKLTLLSSNTYTGTTTIAGGIVNIQNSSAFGGFFGGAVSVSAGATLELESSMLMVLNPLSLSGEGNTPGYGALRDVSGSNMWAGPITIDTPVTSVNSAGGGLILNSIDLNGNQLNLLGSAPDAMIAGVISSTVAGGSLVKEDTGAWILSGYNTFSGGVTLHEGTLNINNPYALGDVAGTFTIGGTGHTVTIDNTSGSAIMLQDYAQVWKNDFDFAGSSNLNLGNGNIALSDNILITTTDGILTAGGTINTTFDLSKGGPGIFQFTNQDIKLHSLSILEGTFESPSAPGSLSLAGNFINNGTFINNNGNVIFIGNTLQTIGGSQETQFNNLDINNAAGAELGNHENIEGTLTLTSGNLVLGAYNLTLGEAAVAGNPSVTHMIVADGTGECRRNFISDGSYLFPVGDASGTAEYTPVTLNLNSGTYNSAWVGVRVTDSKHPDDASTTDYISRYWSISQSGVSSCTYDLTASFEPADITGNINNMITGQWLGSSPWIYYGPVSANEISATGVTAFGDFTAVTAVILPFNVVITANPGASVCRNVPVSLTATPSGSSTYTYLWSPNGETSQTINPSTAVAGSVLYKVAVTDAIGNTITDTLTLRVNAEPTVTATPGLQTICSGTATSIALTSNIPGTIYTWSVAQSGVSGATDGSGNTISQVLSVTGGLEGTATYTIVPSANGCTGSPLAVVITVKPINTITLTSVAGTNNQVKCINTSITNITYATTGATGALFSGLPAGITGNWAGNVATISGIPTSNGISNYTITLTGGCGTVTETGTISVPTTNTVVLSSAAGTDNQSRCINTALTNITYNTTSATGATFTGLPAGVTGSWAANKITISGSPSVSGNFNYNIILTGGCGVVSKTGNISVSPENTITLSSALGTDN